MFVCRYGNYFALKLLFEKFVEWSVDNSKIEQMLLPDKGRNHNALLYACQNTTADPKELIGALIDKLKSIGSFKDALFNENSEKDSALMTAALDWNPEKLELVLSKLENYKTLGPLSEALLSPNYKHMSVLFSVCKMGNKEKFNMILTKLQKAIPNKAERQKLLSAIKDGFSPLLCACQNIDTEVRAE